MGVGAAYTALDVLQRSLAEIESRAASLPVRAAESTPPKATGTLDLIAKPTPRGEGELTWRFGMLLGAANLMVLGIGLAASSPRRASNWNLLFALLAFFIYNNFINLSQTWVTSGRVGLGPALLVLHGSALAVALGLLWWRDHAAVLHFPGRRNPAARPA